MPPPSASSTATHVDYTKRVAENVLRIMQSCKSLVAASVIGDNDTADREGLELVMHSNLILTSVEELLKLVSELKLARLTMDWKKQDEHVAEQIQKFEDREERDRRKLKRVFEEVKEMMEEIDQHRNESRAKRTRSSLM